MSGEPYLLGIDEAGRGPVIGPMVYGAAVAPISRKQELSKMGFADSKTLKESERDAQFEEIKASEFVDYFLISLSPEEISGKMLRRNKYNLNAMSHDAAAQLIRNAVASGLNITDVFVDTVGDPKKYQAKLAEQFPGMKITVCPKADALYPIVSAASVCAKVTRDYQVKEWRFREEWAASGQSEPGRVFGSGYPGDPNTKAWCNAHLDPVFGFPSIIRFSWSTASKLMEAQGVPVVWAEDEDEDEEGDAAVAATPSIMSFFGRKAGPPMFAHGGGAGGSSAAASSAVEHQEQVKYYSERALQQMRPDTLMW